MIKLIKLKIFIMVNMAFSFTLKSILIGNTTPLIYSNIQHSKITLEHIFPKCYMYKKHYNDMHNIFKCDPYINNMRSNYKYVDDYNETFTQLYDSDNYVNTKGKLFCPDDASKGIIARAIMHMSYEYKYDYKKVIDYDNMIEKIEEILKKPREELNEIIEKSYTEFKKHTMKDRILQFFSEC
jgi:hypothetical protein